MVTAGQLSKDTKLGDINSLLHLKNIARICVLSQFWSAIIYLFCSLIFPESNDSAVGCGILAILIALTPAFYAILHKRFLLLFSCISVFNLAPIWFLYLEAVIPGYDAYEYTPSAYRMEAFFWIALFQLFGNLFYILFWKGGSRFSVNSFSFLKIIRPKSEFYVKLTIITFTVPIILFYFYYGSAEILWKAMTIGRSDGGSGSGLMLLQDSIGNSSTLMLPFNSIWQLTPLFSAIAFSSSKSKYRFFSILSLGLGLLVVFVFFLGGTRGSMIFVGSPMLFFLFYYNRNHGFKFWIVATIILFVLISVMELQVRFRGNLLDVIADPTRAAQERGLTSATTFNPTESQRDNNMYLFCLMVKGYPGKYPFQGFNDYYATIVNPVPRFFWSNKPIMIGAKDLSQQSLFVLDGPLFMATTSLTYSVVGEAYLAGGIVGILFYAITYALFFIYFDGIIYYAHKKRPISVGILGSGVFLSFWGYRAFFSLVSLSYSVVLLILALHLIKIFKTNHNEDYLYST